MECYASAPLTVLHRYISATVFLMDTDRSMTQHFSRPLLGDWPPNFLEVTFG
ncbi:hypothetical protein B0H10DRAFT_2010310 [Mycena sp. CBHHK59/15]|nr:hypothetical protein B0H10DRAFT_2010310 [Mycena sp. CBHHK59/15]